MEFEPTPPTLARVAAYSGAALADQAYRLDLPRAQKQNNMRTSAGWHADGTLKNSGAI